MQKNASLWLFAILVLALGLRLVGITSDSLWLDEAYQSMVDAYGVRLPDLTAFAEEPFKLQSLQPAPVDELLRNFRKVDPLCPPLYSVMLNRWIVWFGDSDFAVRSLSALLSTLGVGAVFGLALTTFGLPTAILAGFLQAISPFDIYYAQEARMYSLVTLTATLSCWSYLSILLKLDKPPKMVAPVLYCISTWALINAHYTGLFVLMGQVAMWLPFMLFQRNTRGPLMFPLLGLLVALMWIPWFPMFLQAAAIRTEAFYVAREPSLWWPFYALFIKIPANWITFLAGKRVVAYAVPIYVTSAIPLVLAALAHFKPFQRTSVGKWFKAKLELHGTPKLALAFLWVWAIVPALVLWLLDVKESHRVIEISRYMIGTLPAISLLAGVGASSLLRSRKLLAALLVLHSAMAIVVNVYNHTVPMREPWEKLARAIEQNVPPGNLLVVSQYYDLICLNRYLRDSYPQVGLSPSMGKEHIHSRLENKPRFALVTAQEGESIKDMIPQRFKLTKQIDMMHGLHLRIYERN